MRAIEFVAESHEHGVVSKRYLSGDNNDTWTHVGTRV
jgi:hypothetical protein